MTEVIGHQPAKETLAKARPQTLLLTGPEGVGKRTLARWYAYGLNCERGFPPCGECPSCRLDPHPDHLEVMPEPGEGKRRPVVPVERIAPRGDGESLIEWLETTPRFKRKVAVVDAEHLTEAAANAMLKVLEEPPRHASLVLVARSRDAVLPTLASRSFEVRLGPLPREELAALSQDPLLLDYAEGSPGRLIWAREHREEVAELGGLVEDLVSGLADGSASLRRAGELLALAERGLDPWPLFRRAFSRLPAGPREEALALTSRVIEAHRGYVNSQLLAAWWVSSLRRIYARMPADPLR